MTDQPSQEEIERVVRFLAKEVDSLVYVDLLNVQALFDAYDRAYQDGFRRGAGYTEARRCAIAAAIKAYLASLAPGPSRDDPEGAN